MTLQSIIILIILTIIFYIFLKKLIDSELFKIFLNKFETVFMENSNTTHWSSTRFTFMFTAILSNVILWGGIIYLIITSDTPLIPDVPDGIIILYCIANGVTSVTKVLQKREERLSKNTTSEPPTTGASE